MVCMSCYSLSENDICLSCRKKLFNKKRISSNLEFDRSQFQVEGNLINIVNIGLNGKKLEFFTSQNNENKHLYSELYFLKCIPGDKMYRQPDELPENEHLTMQIANQIYGIETAANSLIRLNNGEPAFLVKRFDIHNTEHFYTENFEQLSIRVKKIIGPGLQFEGYYEEIAKLVRKFVSAYIPAMEELFKRVIFNYVFSNFHAGFSDFSIIKKGNGECKLSPAYNLLNIELHADVNLNTGLKLYKDENLSSLLSIQGYLRQSYFLEFAKRIGIVKKRAEKILDQFQTVEKPVTDLIDSSFLKDATKEKYKVLFREKLKRIRD